MIEDFLATPLLPDTSSHVLYGLRFRLRKLKTYGTPIAMKTSAELHFRHVRCGYLLNPEVQTGNHNLIQSHPTKYTYLHPYDTVR